MVCIRCKMKVKEELSRLNIHYTGIELGEVELAQEISQEQREELKASLLLAGLELMDDNKSVLLQRIKNVIIDMVHNSTTPPTFNFSAFLSQKLDHNYTYLANLFSETQGTTIEKFIILHKIERVKELLVYNELSLTEIAHLMHYSSVSHISTQFKKVTGLTPSHFKKLRSKRRNMLENV